MEPTTSVGLDVHKRTTSVAIAEPDQELSGTGPRASCCTPELQARRGTGGKDKAKGSLKEAAGKVAGDRRTEAEGKTDRAKGKAKDAAQHAKEGAKGHAQ
jgi:uncharacterized protein YjbJ (UPF0337 family)